MKVDDNMIIYVEEKYKSFVEEKRNPNNTLITYNPRIPIKNDGTV